MIEQIYMQKYDLKRAKNPQRIKNRHLNYLKTYPINRKKIIEYQLKRQKTIRLTLINILGGPICSNNRCLVPGRCKDVRCLQIDHIEGGGSKERRTVKNYETKYLYYVKHPKIAKKRLQVLCANCNWIKRHAKKELKRKIKYE